MILQVFSFELGLFSVIAKGIKGKKSQAKKAILQPFQILAIEFAGKSNLKTLVSCELESDQSINTFSFQDKKLACAFYSNEILMRALPERHEYPELFKSYYQLLVNLAKTSDYSLALRQFEIALLSAIGLAPDFTYDVNGEEISADKNYLLIPERGFTQASEFEQASSYSGQSVIALSTGIISEACLVDCKNICRQLMRNVIGDKPLQSRKLWQHISLSNS